ncbi:hypothetical protein JRO89_XS08G0136200 [Xanthoceras sorbifolium]|uniref:DUF8204 domain-containing protein n=1 Tax=Xanthoceras sorbifolium TaxID=99658 RepID=A0ABQ8HPM6_9ROSI|nr:hypothetical protein JRO89_XS08G0136200 [Xanthoceras sorbifolium]
MNTGKEVKGGADNDNNDNDNKKKQERQQSSEAVKGGGGGGGSGSIRKGKSCKGYLYYSSSLKSHNLNPRCVGLPRTLQVPNYVVGQSEVEASKDGRALLDFYYACAGYSIYANVQDVSTDNKPTRKTDLPVCVGLELLVDRKVTSSAPAPAHTCARSKEGEKVFGLKFTRNANLVASGVARNMLRVGNYVKESIDDILFPYRKRPK